MYNYTVRITFGIFADFIGMSQDQYHTHIAKGHNMLWSVGESGWENAISKFAEVHICEINNTGV